MASDESTQEGNSKAKAADEDSAIEEKAKSSHVAINELEAIERRYGIPPSRHLEHARPCWWKTLMELLHDWNEGDDRKKPQP